MNNRSYDLSSSLRTLFYNPHVKHKTNEALIAIDKGSTTTLEQLHASIGALGKFLFVGAQEKDLGILNEEDITEMAWHIRALGEVCKEILLLKENARHELEQRHNKRNA